MFFNYLNKTKLYLSFFFIILFSNSVYCDIKTLSKLDFGKIVVPFPDRIAEITIENDGGITKNNNLYILNSGHRAQILFFNFTPGTVFTFEPINVLDNVSSIYGSSGKFEFSINPEIITKTVDQNGEILLEIGGKLKTDRKTYLDTKYYGNFIINVEIQL